MANVFAIDSFSRSAASETTYLERPRARCFEYHGLFPTGLELGVGGRGGRNGYPHSVTGAEVKSFGSRVPTILVFGSRGVVVSDFPSYDLTLAEVLEELSVRDILDLVVSFFV